MSLTDTLRTRVNAALLSKNDVEKNILRLVIGEIQTAESRGGTAVDPNKIIRKIIEGNKETIAHAPTDPRATTLTEEVRILEELLPKQLTEDQITALIDVAAVRAANNEGQATGIAMKALKGQAVDGNVVRALVKKLRSLVGTKVIITEGSSDGHTGIVVEESPDGRIKVRRDADGITVDIAKGCYGR